MIGRILLAVALIFMAAFDAEHTKRKLAEYGTEIELNPFIRFLCKRIGIDWGVDLGVRLPAYFWVILGWCYPMVLSFIVGTKVTLFLIQQRERLYRD